MVRKHMQESPDFLERFLRKLRGTKNNEEFIDNLEDEMKRKGTSKRSSS